MSRPQYTTTGRLLALAACLQLAVGAAGAAGANPRHGQPPAPRLGGELDLTDHHGLPFNLARLGRQAGLVFFGFTHCSSTCPVALMTARELLGRFAGKAPPIVFVTLDPLSDGPRELREFLGRVDPRLIGLTGSPQQVARVAERYGVGVQARGHAGGVDHSSKWYLLDAQGQVRRVYAHTESAVNLAADLASLQSP